MNQPDVGMDYDCMDAGGRAMQERLPNDSVTRQIQEQSANYGGGAEMPGYATLNRPTELAVSQWTLTSLGEVVFNIVGGGTPSKNNPNFFQEPYRS
jgi:hypothetical protein